MALTLIALITCLMLGSTTTQAETGMKALVLDPSPAIHAVEGFRRK